MQTLGLSQRLGRAFAEQFINAYLRSQAVWSRDQARGASPQHGQVLDAPVPPENRELATRRSDQGFSFDGATLTFENGHIRMVEVKRRHTHNRQPDVEIKGIMLDRDRTVQPGF